MGTIELVVLGTAVEESGDESAEIEESVNVVFFGHTGFVCR